MGSQPTRQATLRFQTIGEDLLQFVDHSGKVLYWIDSDGFAHGKGLINILSGLATNIAGFAQGTVNFGTVTTFQATVTLSAPWVLSTSVLVVGFPSVSTVDHGAEEALVEGLTGYPTNIVPGVSLDVVVSAPNGSQGHFIVNVIGV